MTLALLVALLAVLAGALATWLFEERAGLVYRLAVGSCLGFTVLGLFGYVAAAWMGMGPLSVWTATLLTVALPTVLLRTRLAEIAGDVGAGLRRRPRLSHAVPLVAGVLVLWFAYQRAMIVKDDGIYTSYIDNYADLTLHLGIISGFVYGENYPPEHPEYAGTRLAYPFLADFVAAMLAATGASAHHAMLAQNMILTSALLVILYIWARRLTGDATAAMLTPALVLLCGGLGFIMLFSELRSSEGGVWHYLTHLPHDYSAHEQRWRWANSLVYWFVPMRSMLLGVPLFLVVTGLWWRALASAALDPVPEDPPRTAARISKKTAKAAAKAAPAKAAVGPSFSSDRIMAAAGLIAGLLALAHPHTGVTLGLMGLLLMFITQRWRMWIIYGAVFAVLFAPQGLWAISGSSVKGATFFAIYPGWSGHDQAKALADRHVPLVEGDEAPTSKRIAWSAVFAAGAALYWFENTGLFIPLLLLALAWRGRKPVVPRPLLLFYSPFLLCFIVPNLVKLAPWEWDNIKVLIYWFILSVPLVGLMLSRFWRGPISEKIATAVCILALTLSGGLDIWRVLTGALEWRVFSADEVALGDEIRKNTPPRTVMLNAPLHNHPFILSGRRSFYGYPGTLWTHGISGDIYLERENAMKRIYAGEPDARELIEKYKIGHVVVGPMERANVSPVNEEFFKQFDVVARHADAAVYDVRGARSR